MSNNLNKQQAERGADHGASIEAERSEMNRKLRILMAPSAPAGAGEARIPAGLKLRLLDTLQNCAMMLDTIKTEWSAEKTWSEYDQGVRDKVSACMKDLSANPGISRHLNNPERLKAGDIRTLKYSSAGMASAGAGELPPPEYFGQGTDGSDMLGYTSESVKEIVHAAILADRQRAGVAAPSDPLPPELTWLYTHCRAIGMTCKSDSGKWEHDIALFTDLQRHEIADLKNEVTNLRAQLAAAEQNLQTAVQEAWARMTAQHRAEEQLAAKGQGEPVAWMVGGMVVFRTKAEADANVRNPDIKPVPLYLSASASAQPADPRLEAFIDWYLREGQRSEIHPHGHIERTTRKHILAWLDSKVGAQPSQRGSDAQAAASAWDAVALAVDEAEKNGLDYVTTGLLRKLLVKTRAPLAVQAQEAEPVERRDWENASKSWTAYPLGTKARESWGAGFWLKTERGWKWHLGSTFPTPGGANQVLLPPGQASAQDSAEGEKA